MQVPNKMLTNEDDTATITLAPTELKLPMMDWSVEDINKKFMVFKILANMWLEEKGFPGHKQ